GFDPVANGQLTREDIKKAEADPKFHMKAQEPEVELVTRAKGPRYTPVARRHRVAATALPAADRRAGLADRRHHQADDQGDPRPHALERHEHQAAGSG